MKVSIGRLEMFFSREEVVPREGQETDNYYPAGGGYCDLEIEDGSFEWYGASEYLAADGSRQARNFVLKDIDFEPPRNKVTVCIMMCSQEDLWNTDSRLKVITGPTASGKTSLLVRDAFCY